MNVNETVPITEDEALVKEAVKNGMAAYYTASVSPFTLRAAGGTAAVSPGVVTGADLVLTQSAETWEKTLRGIQNPGGWLSKNLAPKPLPYHQYQGYHTAASSPAIPASLL